jgi:hypothetical protein
MSFLAGQIELLKKACDFELLKRLSTVFIIRDQHTVFYLQSANIPRQQLTGIELQLSAINRCTHQSMNLSTATAFVEIKLFGSSGNV